MKKFSMESLEEKSRFPQKPKFRPTFQFFPDPDIFYKAKIFMVCNVTLVLSTVTR